MAHTKVTKTYSQNTGAANTFSYSGSFDVFKGTEVVALLDNILLTYTASTINESASPREYTVDTAAKTIHIGGANLSSGVVIIRPSTDLGSPTPRAEYTPGASITAADLNNNQTQLLRRAMEYEETVLFNTGGTMTGHLAIGEDQTISFEGATADAYETTITVVDPTADRTITIPNVTGTVVTTGDTGTVDATMMAANSVDSSELVDGSIDNSHMSSNSVDSDQYVDGSIDREHLAADIVNEDKIADNSVRNEHILADAVNSEHYAAGSIDLEHMSANSVGEHQYVDDSIKTAHISNDQIDSQHYAAGSIDNEHIADDAINSEHYAADSIDAEHYAPGSVDGTAIANDVVDSQHYAADSIDAEHYAPGSVDGTAIANDAVDSQHYAAGSIDNEHIADDAIDSEHYAAGSIDNAHIADTTIASGKLAGNIAHSKLAAVSSGNVIVGNGSNVPTSVAMSGDVAIAAGGATTIQANSVEIGMIGCEQTTISDSDSHLPTSGAVVDYVAAVVGPIGGLEVIADDESFPNTIPAAGVVISITDCADLSVNSSGVSTNGDALDNSTITINGFPSELRGGVGGNADPYVFASGAGLMVVSTGSSHTYNYHQALIRESDFVQLSDDINDFNSRYRIGTKTADNSNTNDDGDLFFDTGANKMYVYDGAYNSGGTWKEVTSAGDFKFLGIKTNGQAYNGSLAFDGSATEFDLFDGSSDASINSAAQLIVVLNGVIQKPNSGSYDGNEEGFYLDGSDGIRFCDGPPNGSVCFVTQIGSAVALNEPADNTVTAAKIQSGAVGLAAMASQAVDEDNLYIDNSGSNGQFLSKQSGGTGGLLWADASVGGATGTDYNDDVKVRFGTSNELEIFHDASGNSSINNGAGNIYIQNSGSNDDSDIYIRAKDGEDSIVCKDDAEVSLYYDNVKKLETTSAGVHVWGNVDMNDSARVRIGSSTDLQLYHASGNSYIDNLAGNDLNIRSRNIYFATNADSSAEAALNLNANGSVDLYHNNNLAFKTDTNGVQVLGTEGNDAYLYLYPDEADDLPDQWRLRAWQASQTLTIESRNSGGSYETNIECNGDGAVELYYDGTKKFQTEGGNNAARIYGNTIIRSAADNMDIATFTDDGSTRACNLYYNGSKKLETASGGVNIAGALSTTGHVSPTANNTYDLGDASYRWRNVYTADLQMSNEGSANEVDGTWGNYTIQEGEDDLFLINRRNGKKYKFNLTEVN